MSFYKPFDNLSFNTPYLSINYYSFFITDFLFYFENKKLFIFFIYYDVIYVEIFFTDLNDYSCFFYRGESVKDFIKV